MSVDNSISQLLALAAIAIALVGSFGTLAYSITSARDIRHERDARRMQVDRFLKLQCDRDQYRDGIVIQALKDAQARAEASIPDTTMKRVQIQHLQIEINKLQGLHGKCVSQLP